MIKSYRSSHCRKYSIASYNVFRSTGDFLIKTPLYNTIKLPTLIKNTNNSNKYEFSTNYISPYKYLRIRGYY